MQIHNRCGLCSVALKDIQVVSGQDTLLEHVNLEFHCGELTALIGKNGAGKTTLLKAILGERPYQGEISYTDHHGAKIIRPTIGYVPQQMDFDRSMPVSVQDFLAAARTNAPVWWKIRNREKEEIIKMLDAMDCGYLAKRRLGALSGGELQRVLLAAATNPVPDLLILDEPVSGVDMAGLDLFYRRVTELRDQYHMAILLVSHDLSLIRRYADRVVLLDKTVIAQGDAAQVYRTEAFRSVFGYLEEEEAGTCR